MGGSASLRHRPRQGQQFLWLVIMAVVVVAIFFYASAGPPLALGAS
jgi:hypothetical protein